MSADLDNKLSTALWIAHSLFERGKTSGSSANLSFEHEGNIYITGTGTCFGRLTNDEFAVMDQNGGHIGGIKPSREFKLHRSMYLHQSGTKAVIHTHSAYATLWSCLKHEKPDDVIPPYTPYLSMKVGKIALIPYAPPGSERLFQLFEEGLCGKNGYLLQNHGSIVGGTSLMDAFFGTEELEDNARIAWLLRNENGKEALQIDF